MLELRFDPSLPRQVRSFTLGGAVYRIRARWSDRLASWHLDVMNAQGEPVHMGVRVAAGAVLVRDLARSDPDATSGGLLFGIGIDQYVREDLGRDGGIQILYLTQSEWDEIEAAAIADAAEDVSVT